MSVELLETLKEQAQKLSPQEKAQLKEFLSLKTTEANGKDLGLAGEDKSVIRNLHKNWLKDNRQKYAGQYVALDGENLIANGKTLQEANEKAQNLGFENAFVVYVYPLDYVGEIGGF